MTTALPRTINNLICREILLGKSDTQIIQVINSLASPPRRNVGAKHSPAGSTSNAAPSANASPQAGRSTGGGGAKHSPALWDEISLRQACQRLRKSPRELADGRTRLEAETAQTGLAIPAVRVEMLSRLAHSLEQRVLESGDPAAIAEYKELRETLKQIADEAQNGAADSASPIAEIRRLLASDPSNP